MAGYWTDDARPGGYPSPAPASHVTAVTDRRRGEGRGGEGGEGGDVTIGIGRGEIGTGR